ncbi:hypothetical protein BH20ACT5_BH20ACT5_19740 [soil metagenome]
MDPAAIVVEALGDVVEISADADGDQSFSYDGVAGFIQHGWLGAVELLTITCVAAMAHPWGPALDRWLVTRNAAMLLGGIVAVGEGDTADLLVRYCLPSAGLDPAGLRAVLLPVIAAAADVRQELAAGAAT